MPGSSRFLDTFPAFERLWTGVAELSVPDRVDAWFERYLARWPELLQHQIDCYSGDAVECREIAERRIFPTLGDRLPAMRLARERLLERVPATIERGRQMLAPDLDPLCVLYVGAGCGAGWATSYRGRPAILFGLENIAEEGWQGGDTLAGLTAHELGHLIQASWRRGAGSTDGEGPWWQLYGEGFAQWCAVQMGHPPSWHAAPEEGAAWEGWCADHIDLLAAEFLRRCDRGDVRPFFGSWFRLHGHRHTGYALGLELIRHLCRRDEPRQAALLEDPEAELRPLLEGWSGSGSPSEQPILGP